MPTLETGIRPDRAALPALLLAPALVVLLLPHAPPCFSLTVIGLPCPGCGLGRALLALGRLEPLTALACYPPLLPLVAGYLLAWVLVIRRHVGRPPGTRCRRLVTAVAGCASVAVVGNWVLQLATGVIR